MSSEKDLATLVAVLRRKNQRERQARELAERQLEEFSRELYKTNQSLQRSLNTARRHEAELAYLNEASQQLSSETSLNGLLKNTIEITGKFTHSDMAAFFFTLQGKVMNPLETRVWHSQQGWLTEQGVLSEIIKNLPIGSTDELPSWSIIPLSLADARWLFFINLNLADGRVLWFALCNKQQLLDDSSMLVLDTVRGHVFSAVKKEIADEQRDAHHRELATTQSDIDELKRQLIQSDRMASLGHLAAGIAHEVNNPLGFITSNMYVLEDYLVEFDKFFNQLEVCLESSDKGLGEQIDGLIKSADLGFLREDARDILQTNLDGLSRVAEIVKSLKTFSHVADDQFRSVDLIHVCAQALKVVSNQLKYNFNVTNNLPEKMPLVFGNPGQLQQVMVNILINAVQAMESGGDIVIKAELEGKRIGILFQDSGPGIDEHLQKKLFTPFFTTKEVGVGTGFGLSISHSIMQAHQGQILVESTPGEGACFTLRFPVLDNFAD